MICLRIRFFLTVLIPSILGTSCGSEQDINNRLEAIAAETSGIDSATTFSKTYEEVGTTLELEESTFPDDTLVTVEQGSINDFSELDTSDTDLKLSPVIEVTFSDANNEMLEATEASQPYKITVQAKVGETLTDAGVIAIEYPGTDAEAKFFIPPEAIAIDVTSNPPQGSFLIKSTKVVFFLILSAKVPESYPSSFVDEDNDGIPDISDDTIADAETEEETATIADADGDGVADSLDACPGTDDALKAIRYKDGDNDGIYEPSSTEVCSDSTEYPFAASALTESERNNPDTDDNNYDTPFVIKGGNDASCALRIATGELKCWGENVDYQLGRPKANFSTAQNIGDGTGNGTNGTSLDDITAIDFSRFGAGVTVEDFSIGGYHNGAYDHGNVCAILSNQKLVCWGTNTRGQLGEGTYVNANNGGLAIDEVSTSGIDLGTGRYAKKVSVGGDHICAILDNDSVKCWGSNGYEQLGAESSGHRGDAANEMGDNLNPIDFGTGRTAKYLEAGRNQTCVIRDNDTMVCWGRNDDGDLGNGTSGGRLGNSSSEMGDNLVTTSFGGKTPEKMESDRDSTCALLTDGSIYCWGQNFFGELGQGNNTASNVPLAVALPAGRTAVDMSHGNGFTCAILDNDDVLCWGLGQGGMLGRETTESNNGYGESGGELVSSLSGIDLGDGLTPYSLALGQSTSCAQVKNASDNFMFKCWGQHNEGAFGNGMASGWYGDGANEMDSITVTSWE